MVLGGNGRCEADSTTMAATLVTPVRVTTTAVMIVINSIMRTH